MNNFWDETAFDYDFRHETPRTKYLRAKELEFVRKFAKGLVADLGCGSGFPFLELEKLHVIGFDSSREMLKLLRQKDKKAEVCLCDCAKLPIKANTFDCAVSTLSFLNYCQDYEAVIRQIAQILRLGGRVLLSVISKYDTKAPRLMKVHKKAIKIFGFEFKRLKETFEKHGFRLIATKGLFLFVKLKWGNFEPLSLREKLALKIEDLINRIFCQKGRVYLLAFEKIKNKKRKNNNITVLLE